MITIKFNKKITDEYEYYYEYLKIQGQRKRIIEKKPINISATYKSLIPIIILVALCFFIMTAFVILNEPGWYFWIFYVFVFLLLFLFIYVVAVVNRLAKASRKYKGKRTISIDEKSIIVSILNEKIIINHDDIFCLLIGKYSVFFIPNDLKNAPIVLPIEYKEEVLEALRKENFVIDIIDSNSFNNINIATEKSKKNLKHPTLIRVLIIFLSILSIVSFGIGVIIEMLLNFSSDTLVCNDWIYLYLLIIPVLSILVGICLKKYKIEDTKLSIIGGIIGLVILLLFGDNYIKPMDYSEDLNPYEKVLNMKIPDKAFRVESECYGFVEDEYEWEYNLFIANFISKDGKKFLNSIKKSNKWILSTEVDSKYKASLPVELKVNKDTYIYKYDESNKEENVFVKEKGKNYIFTYDISSNHIEIHEYTLSSRSR